MSAVFSLGPNPLWRYRLDREVDLFGRITVAFLLHNGSTAGGDADDPTSTRCIGFGRRFGARRIVMVNSWAGIATKPRDLWAMDDPVGPDNDRHIAEVLAEVAASGGFVIVGWGVVSPPARLRAAALARLAAVEDLLRASGCPVRALGINGDDSPKHPLYVRADRPALPWPPCAERSAA